MKRRMDPRVTLICTYKLSTDKNRKIDPQKIYYLRVITYRYKMSQSNIRLETGIIITPVFENFNSLIVS